MSIIAGDTREVSCPTCGKVMNGWVAFGPSEQVTFCNNCVSFDEALVQLSSGANGTENGTSVDGHSKKAQDVGSKPESEPPAGCL